MYVTSLEIKKFKEEMKGKTLVVFENDNNNNKFVTGSNYSELREKPYYGDWGEVEGEGIAFFDIKEMHKNPSSYLLYFVDCGWTNDKPIKHMYKTYREILAIPEEKNQIKFFVNRSQSQIQRITLSETKNICDLPFLRDPIYIQQAIEMDAANIALISYFTCASDATGAFGAYNTIKLELERKLITPDFAISIVKRNPKTLQFIPTSLENFKELCAIAITKQPTLVKLIDFPVHGLDFEKQMWLLAIKENSELIIDFMKNSISNATEVGNENYKLGVEMLNSILSNRENRENKENKIKDHVYRRLFENHPEKTYEMCLKYATSFGYIPKKFHSFDVCLAAVSGNDNGYRCGYYYRDIAPDGMYHFDDVKIKIYGGNKSDDGKEVREMYGEEMKKLYCHPQYCNHWDIVRKAAISSVSHVFKLIGAAASPGGGAGGGAGGVLSYDLCLHAVRQCSWNIGFVPFDLQTEELCIEVAKSVPLIKRADWAEVAGFCGAYNFQKSLSLCRYQTEAVYKAFLNTNLAFEHDVTCSYLSDHDPHHSKFAQFAIFAIKTNPDNIKHLQKCRYPNHHNVDQDFLNKLKAISSLDKRIEDYYQTLIAK